MKRTIKLNNNKTLEIDFNIFVFEEHPEGWEPVTLTKMHMATELNIMANGKRASGIYHGNYLNLHDIHFYTNKANAVFYNERIVNIANNNKDIEYVLKVGDAYVMLTDGECQVVTATIEELKEAEAKEKGYYDSIKEMMIENISKTLDEVKSELSKIKEYMHNNKLLSDAENDIKKGNYRNLMLECGEGEYPYAPSKETYEYKCRQLNELEGKMQQYQAGILFHLEV